MKQRIAIIAPASLPIPPVKGGAVEELINLLIIQNEVEQKIDLSIISIYDKDAYKESLKYKHTKFIWLKSSNIGLKIKNRLLRHIILPIKKEPFYNYWQYKIINVINKYDFDKVILESNADFVNILGRKIGKERLFCHMHILPKMELGTFDECARVLSVSNYIRQEIITYSGKPSKDVVVLKNSINEDNFKINKPSRIKAREELGLSEHSVAICYVGRLVELKGVKQLLQAFLRLNNSNARLFIIGSLGGHFKDDRKVSPFVNELLNLAKDRDDITFTDFIDNIKLSHILAAMDIAVMPSFYKEAASVSNVEYQALGLPLITTNSGGIPEYVSKNAIIIEPDDKFVDNLAKQLEILLKDKNKREEYGKAGLDNALQYTKANYYNAFISSIE